VLSPVKGGNLPVPKPSPFDSWDSSTNI
jgi:hypothetical protein